MRDRHNDSKQDIQYTEGTVIHSINNTLMMPSTMWATHPSLCQYPTPIVGISKLEWSKKTITSHTK